MQPLLPVTAASSHSRLFLLLPLPHKAGSLKVAQTLADTMYRQQRPLQRVAKSCATRCVVEEALCPHLASYSGEAGCRHDDLGQDESHLLANHPDANTFDDALCVSQINDERFIVRVLGQELQRMAARAL